MHYFLCFRNFYFGHHNNSIFYWMHSNSPINVLFVIIATSNESIFLRPIGTDELYKVRDDIKFHLYINTAPCGDARIFSPHEDDICIDKHPNRFEFHLISIWKIQILTENIHFKCRKARGQLRTKIESGEGTIPVKSSEGIQTWDGVIQVKKLRLSNRKVFWTEMHSCLAFSYRVNVS